MYTLTTYTLQGLPALANRHVTVYIPCTHFKVSKHLPICISPCMYHVHAYHVHTSRSPSTTNMHVTVYIPCTPLPRTHFKVFQHNQYACHREHTMYTLTTYTLQGLTAQPICMSPCTHLPCTHFKISQHLPICMSPCTYHVHTYHIHTSRSPRHNQYACHRVRTMYTLTTYTLQGLLGTTNMHVTVYVPCTHLPRTHFKVS